jgi:hypothetical protein
MLSICINAKQYGGALHLLFALSIICKYSVAGILIINNFKDQNWLENALEQVSSDSDPVKKLKRWMQRLQEVGDPTEDNLGNLNDIIEEIGSLTNTSFLPIIFK